MIDFTSLGLTLRATDSNNKENGAHEQLEEIRTADRSLVAYFSTVTRMSDGEEIVTTQANFIRRKELKIKQLDAIDRWLHDKHLAAWAIIRYTPMVGAA